MRRGFHSPWIFGSTGGRNLYSYPSHRKSKSSLVIEKMQFNLVPFLQEKCVALKSKQLSFLPYNSLNLLHKCILNPFSPFYSRRGQSASLNMQSLWYFHGLNARTAKLCSSKRRKERSNLQKKSQIISKILPKKRKETWFSVGHAYVYNHGENLWFFFILFLFSTIFSLFAYTFFSHKTTLPSSFFFWPNCKINILRKRGKYMSTGQLLTKNIQIPKI